MHNKHTIFLNGLLLIIFSIKGMEVDPPSLSSSLSPIETSSSKGGKGLKGPNYSSFPPSLLALCLLRAPESLASLAEKPEIANDKQQIIPQFPFDGPLFDVLNRKKTAIIYDQLNLPYKIQCLQWHPVEKHLISILQPLLAGTDWHMLYSDFSSAKSETWPISIGRNAIEKIRWNKRGDNILFLHKDNILSLATFDFHKKKLNINSPPLASNVKDAAWSPSGHYATIIMHQDAGFFLLDTHTKKTEHFRGSDTSPIAEATWGPNDRLVLLFANQTALLLEVVSPKLMRRLLKTRPLFDNNVAPIFNNEGKLGLVGTPPFNNRYYHINPNDLKARNSRNTPYKIGQIYHHPHQPFLAQLQSDKKIVHLWQDPSPLAPATFIDYTLGTPNGSAESKTIETIKWSPTKPHLFLGGDKIGAIIMENGFLTKHFTLASSLNPELIDWDSSSEMLAFGENNTINLLYVPSQDLIDESHKLSNAAVALLCCVAQSKETKITACPHSKYAHLADIFHNQFKHAPNVKKLLASWLDFSCNGCGQISLIT